jgi:hypothetical protein
MFLSNRSTPEANVSTDNIMTAERAEERTGAFLTDKFHNRFRRIRFSQVSLEDGRWQIKAELDLKRGWLLRVRHYLSLTVDSVTGNVLDYKESPAQNISLVPS